MVWLSIVWIEINTYEHKDAELWMTSFTQLRKSDNVEFFWKFCKTVMLRDLPLNSPITSTTFLISIILSSSINLFLLSELKSIATNTTRMRNCGWHLSLNCGNLKTLYYFEKIAKPLPIFIILPIFLINCRYDLVATTTHHNWLQWISPSHFSNQLLYQSLEIGICIERV